MGEGVFVKDREGPKVDVANAVSFLIRTLIFGLLFGSTIVLICWVSNIC